MKPQPIDALTSLRFFAAASIVLAHMSVPFFGVGAHPSLTLGVSFFFVLSGFILTYAYQGRFDLRAFYLSRFARLWPVHLVTMLLAFALLYPFLTQRPEWLFPTLANLLLLHAWIPVVGWVFSFNAVSWSISTELFFYLLFPIARRWILPALAITLFATVAGIAAIELGNFPKVHPPIWNFSARHFLVQQPITRMLEFVVGIGAALIFLKRPFRCNTWWEVVMLVLIGITALTLPWLSDIAASVGRDHLSLWVSQSGGMLTFAAAIYVFAHQRGWVSRVLQWRPLVLLGEISFATYMIHQIIIKLVERASWGVEMMVPTLLLIYIASFALWWLVEVPCKRLILSLPKFQSRRLKAN
jgi:peptidoglycan/LPS O-acetylase OafA/YrhL